MHDEPTPTPEDDSEPRPRRGLLDRLRRRADGGDRSGASWSGRHSFGGSSALASAPGVAEEDRRQGTPDGGNGDTAEPASLAHGGVAEPDWPRTPDDPPLPAPLYRRQTTETRDRVRSIRFTPSAERAIEAAAARAGLTFAGFAGNAALTAALHPSPTRTGPEDDPARERVEALDALAAQLRRLGNNVNQIARAANSGATSAHAHTVLNQTETLLATVHRAIDTLAAEGR